MKVRLLEGLVLGAMGHWLAHSSSVQIRLAPGARRVHPAEDGGGGGEADLGVQHRTSKIHSGGPRGLEGAAQTGWGHLGLGFCPFARLETQGGAYWEVEPQGRRPGGPPGPQDPVFQTP